MDIPEIHVEDENKILRKYTDPIDLSNACRAFYQSRLELTKTLKAQWSTPEVKPDSEQQGKDFRRYSCKKSSLDQAIQVLKYEMACLMEQDLHLMKQMMTLNEEIEELKWRKRHVWGMDTSFYSSDMIQSNISISKPDDQVPLKFSPPSSLSLQLDGLTNRFSLYNDDDPNGTFNKKTMTYKHYSTLRKHAHRSPIVEAHAPTDTSADPTDQNNCNTSERHDSGHLTRQFKDETDLTLSRAQTGVNANRKDWRTTKDVIEETMSTDITTMTKQSAKVLAMDSLDSGIHDCNTGSL